jgi:hypothetical protein
MWRNILFRGAILTLFVGFVEVTIDEVPAVAAARRAFVVGISNYNLKPLTHPTEDAALMSSLLAKFGFNVTVADANKLDKDNLLKSWDNFVADVRVNDEVVVYYSGHGVEINGSNYLVPVDALDSGNISDGKIGSHLILLSKLISDVLDQNVKVAVFVLDACRDNPFPDTKGLAEKPNPLNSSFNLNGGIFIFYASGSGKPAFDRSEDKNSVFTQALTDDLKREPNSESDVVAKHVIRDVGSKYPQTPAYYYGLHGPFCFQACETDATQQLTIQTKEGLTQHTASEIEHLDQLLVIAENYALPAGIPIPDTVFTTDAKKPSRAEIDQSMELRKDVVFLGREADALSCDDTLASDRYPFGCAVLKLASKGDKSLIGSSVPAKVKTSVRQGIPLRKPSCIVQIVKPNDILQFDSVVELDSKPDGTVGDKVYFATVQGTSGSVFCLEGVPRSSDR